jgi:hypothetical protein
MDVLDFVDFIVGDLTVDDDESIGEGPSLGRLLGRAGGASLLP